MRIGDNDKNCNDKSQDFMMTVGGKKGLSFVSWIFLNVSSRFYSFQKAFCYIQSINHVGCHFCPIYFLLL